MWSECPCVPGQNDLGTTDGDLRGVLLVSPVVAMSEKSQRVGQRPVERKGPQNSERWELGPVHVLSRPPPAETSAMPLNKGTEVRVITYHMSPR